MKHLNIFRTAILLTVTLASCGISAQTTSTTNRWDLNRYVWSHGHPDNLNGKPMLDYPAIDNWSIMSSDGTAMSPDGRCIAYAVRNLRNSVDSFIVQSVDGRLRYKLNGKIKPGFFSGDSKKYIYSDKSILYYLNTGSGESHSLQDVLSYLVPGDNRNEWIAIQQGSKSNSVTLQNLLTGAEKKYEGATKFNFDKSNQWLICELSNQKLVMCQLSTGKELKYDNVQAHKMDDEARSLVLSQPEGLTYVDLATGLSRGIWQPTRQEVATTITLGSDGKAIGFMVQSGKNNSVWHWKTGNNIARMILDHATKGMEGAAPINNMVGFFDNDRYIRISLQREVSANPAPAAGYIQLDVWSYKDKVLQSLQPSFKESAPQESILYDLKSNKLLRPEDGFKKLNIIQAGHALIEKKGTEGNGDRFWEPGYYRDSVWLLSLETGKRKLLPVKQAGRVKFSPDGRYVVYYDAERGKYFSHNLLNGKEVNISAGVPDWQLGYRVGINIPTTKKPESGSGIILWKSDNKSLLVNDRYDIWELDVTGRQRAVNITNGYGRLNNIQFRVILYGNNQGNDRGCVFGDTMVLNAFNDQTKYQGFYRKVMSRKGDPELLSMLPYYMSDITNGQYRFPLKARDNRLWLLRRESATDAPNYFTTTDFKKFTSVTNLQPQETHNWFTSELHNFKQLDGTMSHGVLYKPENFDPMKKYPLIISFYGDLSNRMYRYPQSGQYYINDPSIFENPAWMVSHGYLLFIPDIYFTEGKWGPSTVNTVDGAARYLRTLGYVDDRHLGAAGHSNSGRFGYYLLTHSKSFQAMSVGAGTTDIISAGLSLEGQKKSRLEWAEVDSYGTGLGNFWTNKSSWLNHASVLSADKIVSPVLLFHNRPDNAFEPGQAVEMFVSLRRLGKPAWWLQYDNGSHQVVGNDARDFTIRYTQFFDHYLKEAPAPAWMTKGIDFKDKGVITGYELDPTGSCKKDCEVCKLWNVQYKKTPEMFSKELSEWGLEKSIGETGRKISEVAKTASK